MTIAQRQQTIGRVYGLRSAELGCQAAQASALATFLAAPNRAAHWNGMVTEGKRLIVAQRLAGLNIDATEEAITYWVMQYDARYTR